MIRELGNDDTGRYLVTTATGSLYVLDLTDRTMERRPYSQVQRPAFRDVAPSRLRRDSEVLELLMLQSCRVGEPAQCWIQIRDDHVPTLRTTSPVVSIDAAEPGWTDGETSRLPPG